MAERISFDEEVYVNLRVLAQELDVLERVYKDMPEWEDITEDEAAWALDALSAVRETFEERLGVSMGDYLEP